MINVNQTSFTGITGSEMVGDIGCFQRRLTRTLEFPGKPVLKSASILIIAKMVGPLGDLDEP
jgi:hypothetical protein